MIDFCKICRTEAPEYAGVGTTWTDFGVCFDCGWRIAQRFRDKILGENRAERSRAFRGQLRKSEERARLHQEHLEAIGWSGQDKQPEGSSFVYYVAIGDHVKIGYTSRLRQRLSALRVGVDDLLAVEIGGHEQEQLRHKQFDDARVSRRWENFRRSDDLMAHIAELREHNGIPLWLTLRRGKSGPVTIRHMDRLA